jgi:membrane fusion protein (multidrug efflux system)
MNLNSKTIQRTTLLLSIILGAALLGQNSFIKWLTTESTDNAFIDGDISLISPEVSGIVKKINIIENHKVNAQDIVLEIEDADYKARFEQAKAQLQVGENSVYVIDYNIKLEDLNLQKLKDSLNLAQTDLDIAERDYKRTITLNKDNFSSAKILDNAKLNLEKARFALKKAKLDIDSSEYNISLLSLKKSTEMANLINLSESVKLAERSLLHTTLKAPVDGVITNVSAKIGNYITPGNPLLALVHNDKLTIKANFKETQLRKMKVGMPVDIEIDVIKGAEFKGKIRTFAPATGSKFSLLPVDNTTGNFTKVVQRVSVIIDFDLPEQYKELIIPGMSAKVFVNIK